MLLLSSHASSQQRRDEEGGGERRGKRTKAMRGEPTHPRSLAATVPRMYIWHLRHDLTSATGNFICPLLSCIYPSLDSSHVRFPLRDLLRCLHNLVANRRKPPYTYSMQEISQIYRYKRDKAWARASRFITNEIQFQQCQNNLRDWYIKCSVDFDRKIGQKSTPRVNSEPCYSTLH